MLPIRDTIESQHVPFVTWALILANAALFVFALTLPDRRLAEIIYSFGVVPLRFTHPDWAARAGFPMGTYWPFLTTLFLHGGWIHVISNMWTLWIFGDNVEDRMGPLRFLIFYLLCGVLAVVVQLITEPGSKVPIIGASGAIAGVLGAYMLLYPRARIVTLVPIFFVPLFIRIPAFLYLLFWFYVQFYSGALALGTPEQGAGVAWWAHIGGFLAGLFLCKYFVKKPRTGYGRDRRFRRPPP